MHLATQALPQTVYFDILGIDARVTISKVQLAKMLKYMLVELPTNSPPPEIRMHPIGSDERTFERSSRAKHVPRRVERLRYHARPLRTGAGDRTQKQQWVKPQHALYKTG